MLLKKYIHCVYSLLLVGLIASSGVKIEASAPVLPYTAYIVPVTLGTLCIASFGWSWWTAEKVSRIDKNLELVAIDVKDVQKKLDEVDGRVQGVQTVQGEHTQRFIGLQTSSDKNFKALGDDIDALKNMTDKGLKELGEGQQDLMRNVDSVRGLVDRRFDAQSQELAELKAVVDQLNKNYESTSSGNKLTQSAQPASFHPVVSGGSSAPYVHKSVFPKPLAVKPHANTAAAPATE